MESACPTQLRRTFGETAKLLVVEDHPDIGGMGVLSGINRRTDPPSVIVVTGFTDREIAHDAVRLGAVDYILKPYI